MLKACQFRKRVHILKPLGEGVLEMSTVGGMDTVDSVRKEYKSVFSEQKRNR